MSMVFILVLLSQQWSAPVNLGIPGIDDMYPQVHRHQQWWWSNDLCVVWQAFVNGNWEIYSRFTTGYPWSDTIRVTNDPLDDTHPCVTYDYVENGFWCAWERAGDIYASFYDMMSWSSPQPITNDAALDALPSICSWGTTWLVWQRTAGDSVNICSSYNSGSSWSPLIPVTLDQAIMNVMPKVEVGSANFIIVWERENDIFYSTYDGNSWQTPQAITNSPANDSAPDLTSFETNSATVCWQSDESGNWEIYRTAADTFTTHYRVTVNDSADVTPCPLLYTIPILQWDVPMIVFSSNRKGNPDIFSWLDWTGPVPVDTHPAQDMHPVLTANIAVWIWTLWQTDRQGDWDICGSYQFCPGNVAEERVGSDISICTVAPNPFRSSTNIKFQTIYPKLQNIEIYNAAGQLVRAISLPTAYSLLPTVLSWDGTDDTGCLVASGAYFMRLETNQGTVQEKIIKID